MKTFLWIVLIGWLAVDGFLNLKAKPNLGQLLFANQAVAVRRYGSAAFYFLLAAIGIYLGWIAK